MFEEDTNLWRQSFHVIKITNFAGLNTSKFTFQQKQLKEKNAEVDKLVDKKNEYVSIVSLEVYNARSFSFFFLQSTVEIGTFASCAVCTLPIRMMTSPTDKWPSTLKSIFSSYLKGPIYIHVPKRQAGQTVSRTTCHSQADSQACGSERAVCWFTAALQGLSMMK